jgi:hypothetical protein
VKLIRCGKLVVCLRIAAESFLVLVLSGCTVPMRLPSRINGPVGGTLQNDDIDLTFLQVGVTRREEVASRLSRIDTGYSSSRMFWGRWSESKAGYAVIGPLGGGAERIWNVHNLLVSFDESGAMQSKDLIGSEKALDRQLIAKLTKVPPLELSDPQQIGLMEISHGVKEMTLTKDAMLLRDETAKLVEISPLKVTRISYTGAAYGLPSDSSCRILHLNEKTPMGEKLLFCVSERNLPTILKYLQQAGPPNMRWE